MLGNDPGFIRSALLSKISGELYLLIRAIKSFLSWLFSELLVVTFSRWPDWQTWITQRNRAPCRSPNAWIYVQKQSRQKAEREEDIEIFKIMDNITQLQKKTNKKNPTTNKQKTNKQKTCFSERNEYLILVACNICISKQMHSLTVCRFASIPQ